RTERRGARSCRPVSSLAARGPEVVVHVSAEGEALQPSSDPADRSACGLLDENEPAAILAKLDFGLRVDPKAATKLLRDRHLPFDGHSRHASDRSASNTPWSILRK